MLSVGSAAAALALLTFAAGASGDIVSTSVTIDVVAPPPDASFDAFTFPVGGPPRIRVWQEQAGFTLAAPVAVDATSPGIYNELTDLSTTLLPAGTQIQSYYVHFDSPGGDGASLGGSLTFDTPILGVIIIGDNAATVRHLDLSDFLGAPGTLYPEGVSDRGMEPTINGEQFRIFPGSLTIDFAMNISIPGDTMRIITAVPAPGAGVPLFAACMVATASRRRRAATPR